MITVELEEKAPADEVDYPLTFAGEGWNADTITTAGAVAEGLALGSVAHDADTVTFWVSGGTPGAVGIVTITVGTLGGRTYTRRALIPVAQWP